MNLKYKNGIFTNHKPFKTELSKSEINTFTLELTTLAGVIAICLALGLVLQ